MRRPRRTRDDLRDRLLDSALEEFAAKGFDGASTRSIAEHADAYQPQINYHFSSKEALWEVAVDHLFGLLAGEVGDVAHLGEIGDAVELGWALAGVLRRFVGFASAHPELNRIMVREGAEDGARLRWMVEHHVRPWYDGTRLVWERLGGAGIAAPIPPDRVYWVIVGMSSLPFVNAPEVRILTGEDPTGPAWVGAQADAVVATLLPGLSRAHVGAPAFRDPGG